MKTIIVDPFPRQMDLIFSKDKLVYLKKFQTYKCTNKK